MTAENPDPGTKDDDTRDIAEVCFAAEQHDLVFIFHTIAGGAGVRKCAHPRC